MGHVFLSHNSADKPLVERVAHGLVERNIEPWLDKWHLSPGVRWRPHIERAIADAVAVVVFVSAAGEGRIQQVEIDAALTGALADRPLVPVLLPGTDQASVSGLLQGLTWIDMRDGASPEAIDALAVALGGQSGVSPPARLTCPYVGLRAFDQAQARFFRGRERSEHRLVDRLRAGAQVLTLIGPSGCGKSSLIHAGVVPALLTGALDPTYTWSVVHVRLGRDPLRSLAAAIRAVEADGREPSAQPGGLDELAACLAGAPSELADRLEVFAVREGPRRRVLVVVDQLEELVSLGAEATAQRAALQALLHPASRPGRTIVLMTLRADFLDRCLSVAGIATDLSETVELLGPMSADALHDAIVKPATEAGLVLQAGLATRLADATVHRPGGLPLLQFVLERLFAERSGNELTHRAYDEMGQLDGAIAQYAEHELAASGVTEDLARRVFTPFVRASVDRLDSRQPVQPAQIEALGAEAVELLDRFVAKRLLTATESTIELAHEALIRRWTRLSDWVDEDRDAEVLKGQVNAAAAEWAEARTQDHLWRGARLRGAIETLTANGSVLAPQAQAFLDASRAHQAAGRRRRWLLGAVVTTLSLIAALVALSWQSAVEHRARQAALVNAARVTPDAYERHMLLAELDRDVEPVGGLDLVMRALKRSPSSRFALPQNPLRATVDAAGRVGVVLPDQVLVGDTRHGLEGIGPGDHVAFGPAGLLAVAEDRRVMVRWRNLTHLLDVLDRPITALAMGASGDVFAATSDTIIQWSALEEVGRIRVSSEPRALDVLKDGRVAVRFERGKPKIWSPKQTSLHRPDPLTLSEVEGMRPHHVSIGTKEVTVTSSRLKACVKGAALASMVIGITKDEDELRHAHMCRADVGWTRLVPPSEGKGLGVQVSGDGERFALGQADGIELWTVDPLERQISGTLSNLKGTRRVLYDGADGMFLLNRDGSVHWQPIGEGEREMLAPGVHPDAFKDDFALSANGETILTVVQHQDSRVKDARIAHRDGKLTTVRLEGRWRRSALSSDGRYAAFGRANNAVMVVDTRGESANRTLAPAGQIEALAVCSAGRHVAVAGDALVIRATDDGRTVASWDAHALSIAGRTQLVFDETCERIAFRADVKQAFGFTSPRWIIWNWTRQTEVVLDLPADSRSVLRFVDGGDVVVGIPSFAARHPGNWASAIDAIRANLTDCLPVDRRVTLLGESYRDANAGFRACEIRHGRPAPEAWRPLTPRGRAPEPIDDSACARDAQCAERGEYCVNARCSMCREDAHCQGEGMKCVRGVCKVDD